MNLRIQTKPITVGADATVSIRTYMVSGQDFYGGKILTYVVASAPAMTGSVLIQRFRLFLGQCSQIYTGDNVELDRKRMPKTLWHCLIKKIIAEVCR